MTEVYRIGVSIALANGVSPVLAIIGKDLLGLNTSINGIQQNFQGWAAALTSVGLILGGSAILGAMVTLAEKAAAFQDAMTKVSQLNPAVAKVVESGEMKKTAFDLGAKLGLKVEDVTEIYGGIFSAIQNPEHTKELLPYAAEYARLMQLRHPGTHPERNIRTLIRAGEQSGRLTDDKGNIVPEKVQEWFDLAAKLDAATHGQVNPEMMQGIAQQAGGASLRGLTKEGFEHLMILGQMMGGQRAGTALISLHNQMTGAMLKRSAEAMQDYGVLKPGEATSEGGHVSLTEAATQRLLGTLNRDPVAFVDMIVKALEAKGITDKEQQLIAISRMIGRQTSQREIADILLSRAQMDRETQGLDMGMGVKKALAGYGPNYNAAMSNFHAAWHNLMVALGDAEAKGMPNTINKIAGAINWLTDKINAIDPKTMDLIAKGVAGFAIGLITLGTIIGAGLIATIVGSTMLIVGGIVSVVAAIGAFTYLNWDRIINWMDETGRAITRFYQNSWDRVIGVFDGIRNAISNFGNTSWQAVTGVFDGIRTAISSFVDAIVGIYNRAKSIFSLPSTTPAKPGEPKDAAPLPMGALPMRFDPSTNRPRPQQIALSLNVDGHTLAQSISDHLADLLGFPTGAPAPDGSGRYYAGDHNYGSV